MLFFLIYYWFIPRFSYIDYMLQIVVYNQLSELWIDKQTSQILFCLSHSIPQSPIGPLKFHTYSLVYEYAAWYEFIQSLQKKYTQTAMVVDRTYFDWIYTYCKDNSIVELCMMMPAEPYMQRKFLAIQKKLKEQDITLSFLKNTQFLLEHDEFLSMYKKPPVMETFYRTMRKKLNILMQWDSKEAKPEWGSWNYDKENRKFTKDITTPKRLTFEHWVWLQKALDFYKNQKNIDTLDFDLIPLTREQALQWLHYFVDTILQDFGPNEDAMYVEHRLVFHSLLSIPINFWLLSPHEVLDIALQRHKKTPFDLPSIEGFVRQILWWREYMYHWFLFYKHTIYQENKLWHTNNIPYYFWETNKTPHEMNCLNTVIKAVDKHAYSHHIERLMIVWNISLLTQTNPKDVLLRFWEQYLDAFERVVVPNVMWMSQFADGGGLATKPYVSSANYINKMSNFCTSCHYDHKKKSWSDACPVNYLYWTFVADNEDTFKRSRQPFLLKHLSNIDIKHLRELRQKFFLLYFDKKGSK